MSQTDENQLGEFKKEYETNYVGTIFLLLLSLGSLGTGAYFIINPFFGGTSTDYYISEPLGLGFAIGGLFALRYVLKNRIADVRLYQRGLAITVGGKRYVVDWSEIAAVKELEQQNYVNGVRGTDTYEYTIETTHGESFRFTRLVLFAQELGEIINRKTFELMHPMALKKIRAGEKVVFDSLIVDSNGLTVKTFSFLWNDIISFSVVDGLILITVKNDERTINAPYATMPNAHVLVALLREFIN